MKISYLIALYNKVNFIEAAVKSVLMDQSDSYDLEICIVDDGSTDGSFEKVSALYSDHPCVKLARFPANRGKNAAYNAAFDASSGDFISLLGADDLIIRGRTGTLLDACMASGKTVYGGLEKRVLGRDIVSEVKPPVRPTLAAIAMQNSLSGGCLMMPRVHAEAVFPVPENLKFEDWWISFKLLERGLVKTIQTPVLVYNIHGENDSGADIADFSAVRRDYLRHFDYLERLIADSSDPVAITYLQRSLSVRRAFLGDKDFAAIFKKPFDKSWLRLVFLLMFGGRAYCTISELSKKVK